ncbi:hypothetical protein Q3G72_014936 [Acer saccharum]|nr:hypothetical protein Q3G72_014936 [Acer saccharum]
MGRTSRNNSNDLEGPQMMMIELTLAPNMGEGNKRGDVAGLLTNSLSKHRPLDRTQVKEDKHRTIAHNADVQALRGPKGEGVEIWKWSNLGTYALLQRGHNLTFPRMRATQTRQVSGMGNDGKSDVRDLSGFESPKSPCSSRTDGGGKRKMSLISPEEAS